MSKVLRLCAGELVEVRGKEEILKTLDHKGQLDGMPFMPEMFAFCGLRFRVKFRAHKTCDTVFPIRSRSIINAVHLETRCDGQAHGGCQAGCLIFWKEAWLKRVDRDFESPTDGATPVTPGAGACAGGGGCSEADVYRFVRWPESPDESDAAYVCQATRLPYASEDLSPYDVRQYIEDYTSGNVGIGQWIRGVVYITYNSVVNLGVGLGAPLRWLYDLFQSLWGGLPYPRWPGKIPIGQRTPIMRLDLQVGELVRVKPYQDILATCTQDNRNRGLGFDAEMMPYCGGTYRVLRRVSRILNEKTGKMQNMQNPCIVLEDVVCQGRYSECRLFCPRSIFPYWREIWLERVEQGSSGLAVSRPTGGKSGPLDALQT